MLVISRKRGQAVVLGQDIEVTVLRVEGDCVRLGIKAPRQVPVVRRELLEEIRSETECAPVRKETNPTAIEALRRISHAICKPKG